MVEGMVGLLIVRMVAGQCAARAQGALGLQDDGAVDHAAVELGGAG